VAADPGYGEARVDDELEALGVKRIAIPRRGKANVVRQQIQSERGFTKLVKGRTGCEGRVACLKRNYGWSRRFTRRSAVLMMSVGSQGMPSTRTSRCAKVDLPTRGAPPTRYSMRPDTGSHCGGALARSMRNGEGPAGRVTIADARDLRGNDGWPLRQVLDENHGGPVVHARGEEPAVIAAVWPWGRVGVATNGVGDHGLAEPYGKGLPERRGVGALPCTPAHGRVKRRSRAFREVRH
jgi:hypothetical protein